MLDDFLKEIQELKEYKQKYDFAMQDKQRMSDELFKLMSEQYNKTSLEDRISNFRKEICSCCRYRDDCEMELPENIGEPIISDKAWIPTTKSCGEFHWA